PSPGSGPPAEPPTATAPPVSPCGATWVRSHPIIAAHGDRPLMIAASATSLVRRRVKLSTESGKGRLFVHRQNARPTVAWDSPADRKPSAPCRQARAVGLEVRLLPPLAQRLRFLDRPVSDHPLGNPQGTDEIRGAPDVPNHSLSL